MLRVFGLVQQRAREVFQRNTRAPCRIDDEPIVADAEPAGPGSRRKDGRGTEIRPVGIGLDPTDVELVNASLRYRSPGWLHVSKIVDNKCSVCITSTKLTTTIYRGSLS